VNSALIFRIGTDQALLAAKALRSVKHHLRKSENNVAIFPVLNGLAMVAAVTRSSELAEELRILTRRCRYEPGQNLSVENAMWIGLIAAAAHVEISDWCNFAGEWITELAFQSMDPAEIEQLHSHVEKLCHIEPDLWAHCGRANAALKSLF